MSPRMARPPLLARALARLIVGRDAEVVRGDLEEAFQRRLAEDGRRRAGLAQLADAAATLLRWWASAARRRPAEPAPLHNPGGPLRSL